MKLSSNPRDGSGRTWQRTRGIQTRARAFKTFRKTFLCQHISRFTATFRQDWDKLSMFVGGFIQTLYTGTILHPFHSQFCFQTTDMNAFLCVFICTIHHTLFNTPSFTTTWRTEDDLRQCLKKSRLRRKQCLGRRQVSSVQHCPNHGHSRHNGDTLTLPSHLPQPQPQPLACVLGRDTQAGPQRVPVLTPWYSITWSCADVLIEWELRRVIRAETKTTGPEGISNVTAYRDFASRNTDLSPGHLARDCGDTGPVCPP